MSLPTRPVLAAVVAIGAAAAQVTLPPHAVVHNGFSRGFNVTAQTAFLIGRLDLPAAAFQAGDTASYLVRVNGVHVLHSIGHAGALATNVPIDPGDVVDVIGNWSRPRGPAVPPRRGVARASRR